MFALALLLSLVCFKPASEFLTDTNLPVRVLQQDKGEVRLICELSKQKVFVDEPLVISYKLLFTGTVKDVYIVTEPGFNNIAADDLNLPRNLKKENYKGKEYKSYTLKKFIVTPQRAGSITINPLTIKLQAELPPDPKDFFASERFEEITISSAKQELHVQPLPLAGYSNNFSGAVGEFNIKSSLVQDTISLGYVINLNVTINGKGSIINMRPPRLNFPEHVEIYPPSVESETLRDVTGYTHTVIYKYKIEIEKTGQFDLSAIPFKYFNPNREQFVTQYSDPQYVYITPSKTGIAGASNSKAPNELGQKRPIDSDLIQINELSITQNAQPVFFGSTIYYTLIIVQLLFLGCTIAYSRYALTRFFARKMYKSRAYNNAIKKLNQLSDESGDFISADSYNRVHHVVDMYLCERFTIPKHLLLSKSVRSNLQMHAIPTSQIDELLLFRKEFDELCYSECVIKINKAYKIDAVRQILRRIEKSAI